MAYFGVNQGYVRQQGMLKMMAIADNRHFSYRNESDLVDFIASEMQKKD
jgi:hypothetical protein